MHAMGWGLQQAAEARAAAAPSGRKSYIRDGPLKDLLASRAVKSERA